MAEDRPLTERQLNLAAERARIRREAQGAPAGLNEGDLLGRLARRLFARGTDDGTGKCRYCEKFFDVDAEGRYMHPLPLEECSAPREPVETAPPPPPPGPTLKVDRPIERPRRRDIDDMDDE